MAISIDGSNNTIAGLAVGGLPDGIVDTDMIANSNVTSGKLASGLASQGITHLNVWYLTSSFQGGVDPIVNWAKYNLDYNTAGFGADMTESSGIWTFPVTGFWQVNCQAYMFGGGSGYGSGPACAISAALSTDSGSSYDTSTRHSYSNVPGTSGYWYSQNSNTHYYDVTNVATTRLKLIAHNPPHMDAGGTFVRFMRLGDT